MTGNQIAYQEMLVHRDQHSENVRHNLAEEAETGRSHRANEQISISNLAETGRHNLATEGETSRHNIATEGIDLSKLAEDVRSHKANEAIGSGNLAETIRSHQANEALQKTALSIQAQANEINKLLGLGNIENNAVRNKIEALKANLTKALNEANISHLNTQDAQNWTRIANDFAIALKKLEVETSNANKGLIGSGIQGLLRALGPIAATLLK